MIDLLLYNLFSALRKEDRLVAGGVGEYLVLQEYMSKGFQLDNFDDFSFACETLLVKSKREQPVFRKILNDWRVEIEKYIHEQYAVIEKTKNPEPVLKTDPAKQDQPIVKNPVDESTDLNKPPVQNESPTIPTPSNIDENSEGDSADSVETDQGEMTFSFSDETTAQDSTGRIFRPDGAGISDDSKKTFLFGNEYFPVANRYLRQNWRSLKNRQEINQYGTVDILLTIDQIAQTGLFTQFQYQKKTQNLLSLFVFVDRGRSMASAEAFGKELADSALQSGSHLAVRPYYFQDLPEPSGDEDNREYHVYNEEETETYTISSLFRKLVKKNIVTLLYSDAGAIAGSRNESSANREKKTIAFLRYLQKNTAYTAWLNPAPKHRWQNTPSENLCRIFPDMPMFEANSTGLEQAINALKGKTVISN